jgi:hypothetical protein
MSFEHDTDGSPGSIQRSSRRVNLGPLHPSASRPSRYEFKNTFLAISTCLRIKELFLFFQSSFLFRACLVTAVGDIFEREVGRAFGEFLDGSFP